MIVTSRRSWAWLCAAAGLAALFATNVATGRTSGETATPTTVTVTAGKPTEFAFKLSKSEVPVGTVVFKVTNKGKIPHSFKICTSASGGTANACTGKATAVLKIGKSATLTVSLKKGRHEYLCTVTGHAKAGMKGILGVGVAPGTPLGNPSPTPTPTPVGTTTTATTPPPLTGPVVGDPVAGATLFQQAGCGGCHTLKAAGTTGDVGPNLDEVAPDEQTVITNVTFGNPMGMPAFSPQFSTAQIQNIAAYVYSSTHH